MRLGESKYSKNSKIKSIRKEKEESMVLKQEVLYLPLFRSKKSPEFMKSLIQQVAVQLNRKDKTKGLKIVILSKASNRNSKIDRDHHPQIKDHPQMVAAVIKVQLVVLALNLTTNLKDFR